LIEIDRRKEDETGFTMRLAAVILPDLGTGPDVPIVVSHWFAARWDRVWEGERLVEVLVGPATYDVSAPASGRLAEIRGREDDRVVPGSVLGLVAIAEDDASDDGIDRQHDSRRRSGDEPPSSRPTT
jgi:pyruvate/2-oxoglutarate dehydrogenase complex dihydrolipoamide acyltransferase (E2) component